MGNEEEWECMDCGHSKFSKCSCGSKICKVCGWEDKKN
jgi:hypothetical protein